MEGEEAGKKECGVETSATSHYCGTSANQIFCLHCDYKNIVFMSFVDVQLGLEPPANPVLKAHVDDSEILTEHSKDPNAVSKSNPVENFQELAKKLGEVTKSDHVSHKDIPFSEGTVIPLDKPDDVLYLPNPLKTQSPKLSHSTKVFLSLENVLQNHFSVEFLSNIENLYTCRSCVRKGIIRPPSELPPEQSKVGRYVVRKSYLFKSPSRLCLTLKRFKNSFYGGISMRMTKNNIKVLYPHEIDLTKYFIKENDLNEKFVYCLEAVVCHSGSLQFGHYTAYARHQVKGEWHWYYYSDTHHIRVDASEVINWPDAFMLFYKRMDNDTQQKVESK